jgi:hypothetical protein
MLLHFGERIVAPAHPEVRPDHVRQVMQVRIDGVWVDAIDAADVGLGTSTGRTDVKHESTDED